jgi:hypothetical protein
LKGFPTLNIPKLLLLVILLLFPVLSPAQSAKVLFDNTLNETAGNADWIIDTDQPVPSPSQSTITPSTGESFWLGAISAWGVDLVQMGYTVHTLTTAYPISYGNASNPYDLSNYKIFVVCEPQDQLTASEKTAILAFVQNGGGLMMVADHNASDRNSNNWDSPQVWNDLGSGTYFGIHFQSAGETNNSISQVATNISTSATDSIIHGPAGTAASISYHAGTTMNMLTANNPSAAGHIWMNGVARGSTQVVAATSRYGLGKVAAVGDSSPADDGTGQSGNTLFTGWTEVGATDNIVFLNMCAWLAAPSAASAPAQVTLVSPANAATSVASPSTFRWNKPAGATGYQIDVSLSNTFSTNFLSDSTLADTSRSVGGFALNTTYYWRVRAKNASGWGSYSATRSLTSWNVPPAVTLLSPANLAANVASPALLQWNKAAMATAYQVDVSTSNTFSPIFLSDSTLADSVKSGGGLALNTIYYWRVRAKNGAGWGAYSSARSFTTWDIPPAVVLVAPADAATDIPSPAAFRWNAVNAATAYQIDVSTSDVFATVFFSDSTVADTTTSFGGLAAGASYYWRVRAKNGAGWGPYGATRSFATQVPPGVVTLIDPAAGSTGNAVPVAFRWSRASGASGYEIDLSLAADFAAVVLRDSSLVDTTLSVGSLLPDTAYYWRIRAKNSAGWGGYSAVNSFRTWSTPGAAILEVPSDSAAGVPMPVEFRWHSLSGALTYRLVLTTDAPSPITVIADSSITDTTAVIPSLAPGTGYRWTVAGRNLAGWGPPSEARMFATWQLPGQTQLAAPVDGASGATMPVALAWHPVAGATHYRLMVATDPGFALVVADDSTLTDTVSAVAPADTTAEYYWRVRAKGTAGWGAFSAVRSFSFSHLQTVTGQFGSRWNLVSIPFSVADRSVATIFPGATSAAYAFDGGYVQHDTLSPGVGYWLKFPSATTDSLTGTERLRDTIAVHAGWNIVGALSVPAAASAAATLPPGLIVSQFYGYDGSYTVASTLFPFRSYWVKVSADGLLILQ